MKELISVILKPIYFIFLGIGSFAAFLVNESLDFLKGSHEQVIYTARYFRKKHKPKVFHVNITLFQKINPGIKLKILIFFLFFSAICGFFIWYFIFRSLPNPSELTKRKINVTTSIYDRNGVLLYQIYKDQNRTPVGFGDIPESLKLATLASEDVNFYSEHGFSLKGIIRALIANITNNDLTAGGSTITQQLVKNALLSPEKTVIRKIKELVLAIKVDAQFSKDEILNMYLNEVPYGGSAYGVEAASEQYFGKSVDQLDLAESALLAGLPKSPTTYSPFGTQPELARERQQEVLQLMVNDGFITKEQFQEAAGEKLNFKNKNTNIKAPHFVMYIRQKLVDEYGEEIVTSGGLNVITTLDMNIQKMAEESVATQVTKLRGMHVTNGAALVIDPATGEILAMVGSKDYFDMENDGNVNVTLALRPPGSSIKVVNYAYALSHGFTPASIILDAPVSFNLTGSPVYTPVNYDGKFVGNITLRGALAQSRNVPAVKVLSSYGVDHMINLGQEMGITTWNEKNTYGLSLTLGGGTTKLIDLARVYATIANYGNRPSIVTIKKITDYKGNNLPFGCDGDGACDKARVVDARVAYQIISILSDNSARAAEFGQYSSLVISNHPEVAVKTGTSNSLRDNLTIGFTKNYLAAVWVGNNDNSPMSKIASGITGAAPIWNEIMSKLLAEKPAQVWDIPTGLKQIPCRGKNEFFFIETDTKNLCNIREGTPSGQLSNH